MGAECQFGKMRKFWRQLEVMAAQQCACHSPSKGLELGPSLGEEPLEHRLCIRLLTLSVGGSMSLSW